MVRWRRIAKTETAGKAETTTPAERAKDMTKQTEAYDLGHYGDAIKLVENIGARDGLAIREAILSEFGNYSNVVLVIDCNNQADLLIRIDDIDHSHVGGYDGGLEGFVTTVLTHVRFAMNAINSTKRFRV